MDTRKFTSIVYVFHKKIIETMGIQFVYIFKVLNGQLNGSFMLGKFVHDSKRLKSLINILFNAFKVKFSKG